MRFWRTRLTVGDPALATPVGFTALSLGVDNPTNQWIQAIPDIFVAPYTAGAVIVMVDELARAKFSAPIGLVLAPTITGQFATLTYYDTQLTPSTGVGVLSQRAPYYDRNPLSLLFAYQAKGIGSHLPTSRWTYTVPTGRRSYIEGADLKVEAETNLTVSVGTETAESYVLVTPSGGSAKVIFYTSLYMVAVLGARDELAIGGNMELQSGDVVAGFTQQVAGSGGTCEFLSSVKMTEFDA